jgi:hypothetical protein
MALNVEPDQAAGLLLDRCDRGEDPAGDCVGGSAARARDCGSCSKWRSTTLR